MNIIQLQEMARNASEQQLINLASQPNPSVMPPYLVTGELMRRKSIREKMAQAPKESVSEEVLAEAMQGNKPRGIGGLTSNMQAPLAAPQEEVMTESITETGLARLPAPNIGQNYENGGIVGYDNGGEVEESLRETFVDNSAFEEPYGTLPVRSPMAMPTELTLAQAMQEEKDLKKAAGYDMDIEQTYRDTLAADRIALKEEKDNVINNALIRSGLSMMGGTSPNAFENIAAGASVGFDAYVKDTKAVKQEKKLLDQAERASNRAENAMKKDDFTAAKAAVTARDAKMIEVAKINLQYNVDVQKALASAGADRGNIYDKAFDNALNLAKAAFKNEDMYNSAFKRDPEKMQQTLNKLIIDQINLLTQTTHKAENLVLPVVTKEALDSYRKGEHTASKETNDKKSDSIIAE